ncbi:D-glycero-alpha-D-manno-heptose-1,7-bisphosphate 7-phosphatase [Streptomyces sp. G5(2025)]|uniref:D-glycero-alpha-D-manno-heptose-1,7-bisphosphate 7-phosphatase n=1 Tax=Streptomyces sp. G5(2025) TaxID=3406628 RepID=UPI003C1A59D7
MPGIGRWVAGGSAVRHPVPRGADRIRGGGDRTPAGGARAPHGVDRAFLAPLAPAPGSPLLSTPDRGPWLADGPAQRRRPARPGALPAAVLFDRDGTLVVDVPYNGDPARVRLMPGARDAVDAVRAAGLPVGVVSNQSGVARGLLTRAQVEAVRRRVDELLGPFQVWAVCPHGPDDGCRCRKPAPGLILAACERLGVPAARAAVIGDIGADMTAARAAGARGVLVPTPVTRAEEIEAADTVASDLLTAVRLALGADPGDVGHRPLEVEER